MGVKKKRKERNVEIFQALFFFFLLSSADCVCGAGDYGQSVFVSHHTWIVLHVHLSSGQSGSYSVRVSFLCCGLGPSCVYKQYLTI